jgi:hypothetical protein
MRKRTKKERYFVVCVNNKKYEASLEVGKLYRVVPDEEAESDGYLRVVDESGETTDIQRTASFASKCPGRLSEPY